MPRNPCVSYIYVTGTTCAAFNCAMQWLVRNSARTLQLSVNPTLSCGHHLLAVLLLLVSSSALAQYQVNGSAASTSCNCYTLTQAVNGQSGSVWNVNLIDLNTSFDFEFEVFLGNNNGGADGIVFGLQPNGTSVGTTGGGMGLGGVVPSLGVYIDTYQNGAHGDPFDDHISINANGDVSHLTANNLAGPQTLGNVEDGQWHDLHVVWDAPTNTLTVEFDGNPVASYTGNIVANIFGGNPQVYWGFTAATGGLNNLQQVCTQLNPAFTIPSDTTCVLDPVTFTNNSTTFGGVSSLEWKFGDGTTSTQSNPTHTYAAPGVYDVRLIIADNSGCSDSATTTVTVVGVPDAGLGFPLGICGSAAAVNLFDQLGSNPDSNGTWAGPSPLPGGFLGTFTPGAHTDGTYQYTIPGYGSCLADTSTVVVTVGFQPDAGTDGPPQTYCSSAPNDTLFHLLGATPDSNGVWTGPSALGGGFYGVLNPSQAATGTYTYTSTGAGCPDSSASIQITINQLPNAGNNSNATPCTAGGSTNLIQYLGGSPDPGGLWLFPNLTPAIMPIDLATAPNGLYFYIVGTPGCLDSAQLGLNITQPPFAGISTSVTVCADAPTFGLFDTLPGGPDGGGTWYNPLGGVMTVPDFEPGVTMPGVYNYVVDGSAPCADDSATVEVIVSPVPIPSFSLSETDGCSPVRTTFSILTDSLSLADWEWDFGDGRSSEQWKPTRTFALPWCYDVTLSVETHDGCTNSTTVAEALCVRPLPNAAFDYVPETPTALDPAVRFWDQSTGAVSYEWLFNGVPGSTEQHPAWLFEAQEDIHEVCQVVTNQFGCVDTTCRPVEIAPAEGWYIPKAFTPDADGLNDDFGPVLTYTPTDYAFSVYNRWGELMFRSETIGEHWDGKHAGNVVTFGTYAWKLELESKLTGFVVHSGWVTVVR